MMMEMMETWKSYYEQLENNDGTDGNFETMDAASRHFWPNSAIATTHVSMSSVSPATTG